MNKLSTPRRQNCAFTLAETLIALVIIGVVAVITVPTLLHRHHERVNSQRQANIVHKVTQATDMMKANNALGKFSSTEYFVNTLKKYLSIEKICDSSHIADCWPSKIVRTADGEDYEVKDCKTRKDLGFDDEYGSVPNMGVVLADGASLIMTYNPASGGIPFGAQSKAIVEYLPIGNGFKEFLQYTSETTSGLAFVMDVNGGRGPNSETVNGKYYDIRSLNGAKFAKKTCAGTIVSGKCYISIPSPTHYDCISNPTNKYCAQRNPEVGSYADKSDDCWAGANNDCEALGGRLPTVAELQSICRDTSLMTSLGLYQLDYYSSELGSSQSYPAVAVNLAGCSPFDTYRNNYGARALCIGK